MACRICASRRLITCGPTRAASSRVLPTVRFQHREPRHVHPFERKLALESRLGGGVQLARRSQRALAIEVGR